MRNYAYAPYVQRLVTVIKRRSKHCSIDKLYATIAIHPEYVEIADFYAPEHIQASPKHVFSILVLANRLDCVKLLTERGDVDVNQRATERSSTPLYFAAMRGNLDMCRLLFASGADANVTCLGGRHQAHTHLQMATIWRNDVPLDMPRVRRARFDTISRLRPAHLERSDENRFQTCMLFLANGADVNGTDAGGNTLMHALACLHVFDGYDDNDNNTYLRMTYEALIAHGAHIDTSNKRGMTPLCLYDNYRHTTSGNAIMGSLIRGTMRERYKSLFYVFLCGGGASVLSFDVLELIAHHLVDSLLCATINNNRS